MLRHGASLSEIGQVLRSATMAQVIANHFEGQSFSDQACRTRLT